MSKYDGTKTQKNLEAAFAGESEARNKYKLKEYADLQVEEYLAEEFRKYMLAKEANVKLSFPERVSAFFKDIFDLVYNFFTGKTRLNEYDINPVYNFKDDNINKSGSIIEKLKKLAMKYREGEVNTAKSNNKNTADKKILDKNNEYDEEY